MPLTTVICPTCALVSHHPLPDKSTVAAFYAKSYRIQYKRAREPKAKHALRAIRGAIARARRLSALVPAGASVLDVGASSGEFVYVMEQIGYRARGLEPNEGYAAFARRTYGIDLENGGFDDVHLEDETCDLITMNHVMEHLVDPPAAFEALRRALTPDGLLFIEVPNLLGVKKQAANVFHTAHVWNFTPQTLIGLAARCGFVPIPHEDLGNTSIVFRKAKPAEGAGTPNPGLADQLKRQLATEQSLAAYMASGAPFLRRWHRLCRNIGEYWTTRRYSNVKAMADDAIQASGLASQGAVAASQDRPGHSVQSAKSGTHQLEQYPIG